METEKLEHGLKAKTIKGIIKRKIDQWLESVEDESLRKRMEKGVIVTGGSIASMLLGEPVNDFDVYLRSFDLARDVAQYYVKRFTVEKAEGIKAPIYVSTEDGRVKIVVKSSGIASEQGTNTPYEYFEGSPDENAAVYVGEVINDPAQIEDTYQEIEEASLNTTGDDRTDKKRYHPIFLTTNAITLSDKLQIVLRFFGEPDTIHENYDFVHCTNYWQSWDGGKLVLRPDALEALLAKELRYVGSKYPICSVVRLRKFISRGWRINAGQILKMAMQISQLDLTDIKILEDQLTGVDTAYFLQLIQRLKENDPEKVNGAYLIEIIDRIF